MIEPIPTIIDYTPISPQLAIVGSFPMCVLTTNIDALKFRLIDPNINPKLFQYLKDVEVFP